MTVGLEAVLDLPRTPLGDETRELVTRGDLAGASFAFQTARDAWCQSADGTPPRVIEEIGSISDVSVCALPAYPATSVMVRAAMNQSAAAAADNRRRQLELLGVDLGAPRNPVGEADGAAVMVAASYLHLAAWMRPCSRRNSLGRRRSVRSPAEPDLLLADQMVRGWPTGSGQPRHLRITQILSPS